MHSQYFCVVGLTVCFLKSLQNHVFTAIPSSHGVTCISFGALTPISTWSCLFGCSPFHKKKKESHTSLEHFEELFQFQGPPWDWKKTTLSYPLFSLSSIAFLTKAHAFFRIPCQKFLLNTSLA